MLHETATKGVTTLDVPSMLAYSLNALQSLNDHAVLLGKYRAQIKKNAAIFNAADDGR